MFKYFLGPVNLHCGCLFIHSKHSVNASCTCWIWMQWEVSTGRSTMVDIITNQVIRADSYPIRVTAEIEDTEAFRQPTQMEWIIIFNRVAFQQPFHFELPDHTHHSSLQYWSTKAKDENFDLISEFTLHFLWIEAVEPKFPVIGKIIV